MGDGPAARRWFVPRAFYGPEVDAATGRQFSWTSTRARLLFPELDRSQAYRLRLEIGTLRPAGVPFPEVRITVDGVPLCRAANGGVGV
jgi:hypothetical protein